MDATARKTETRPPLNHMAMDLHKRSAGAWYIMGRGRDRHIKLNSVDDTHRPMHRTAQKERTQRWLAIRAILNDSSTCKAAYTSSNFDGQISGADYCTKLSACRNFVVFKCKECGTSVDKIEIENKLLLMSREPQDVKFTVTCYSNTKRLCNPLNTTWLEVEFIWFQHCDDEAANRTKRFVPGCGVVGPGGWMHGLNRPAPPMPFFGEPMLPHPPMRPSPCQQTPPGCRGGRCGGDRGRGPPPPRPCHMGGPCGGRPPPRPCGMGGPCDRGRGRPPPRPCGMGGPCDRGRPPPRPCHMGGPCVGRPPPPIPCSMGGPCDNNLSPTRTPPYDGN
uniref:Uncharacterized protein n=1 Tax=Romanomermis culicivorax TaxID=13658 RepID=A0A915KSW4_ROMCU